MRKLDITVCVYDSGSFVEVAKSLVPQVKKVYYHSPWEYYGFPLKGDDEVGTGIEGIERLSNPFSKINEINLWIFTDVYYSDTQLLLKSLGKLVWGSGITSWMELDRFALREWLDKNEMPTPECEVYEGLDDVIKNMPKDKFMKFSKYRGDGETFKFYDKNRSEFRAKELEVNLGVLSKEVEIIAETKIEGYEIGGDNYNVDGKFPDAKLWGIEIKDTGYKGKISEPFNYPKQLKYIDDNLSAQFSKEKMRSMISYEIRTDNKVDGTLIDMTMRFPNPPFQAQLEMIDNLAEIFYYGAQGIMVQPKWKAKYCTIAIMQSDFAKDNIMPVKIPKENKQWVKLMGLMERKGECYSITHKQWGGEFGAVLGIGNTSKQSDDECLKHCEGIEGDSLYYKYRCFNGC